jgi:DNA-3-methyladenine glycosylase
VTGNAPLARILSQPVLDVAIQLIGMRMRTEMAGDPTEVMLTEVEAYAGEHDPASHAFRGRTARNGAMFGPAGTLYVYRSYGIHWCMNIVTGAPGVAHAVLLRGGIPLVGEQTMARRRGRSDRLTDGPGKLAQALGVVGDHDGTSVLDGPVRLLPGTPPPETAIIATPRIGISRAVDLPWRFVLAVRH